MIAGLRARTEWQFFSVLARVRPGLSAVWWALVIGRGLLPAVFVLLVGALVESVRRGEPSVGVLAMLGVVFVVMQLLAPLHVQVSANLGDCVTSWLSGQLLEAATEPDGMRQLESPDLVDDLTAARDFELGLSGPTLSLSIGFIASGLVDLFAGLAQVAILGAFHWWAPVLVGGAWASTHWLLRESAGWDRSARSSGGAPSTPTGWRWTRPPPRR